MKPAFEDSDENDLLLFHYLEGNLSADEEKELEQALLTDVSLQTELGYWRESYVEADAYDTTILESKLLLPENTAVQTSGSLQAIIATLLASLLSLIPVTLSVNSPELWRDYVAPPFSKTKSEQLIQASLSEDSDKKQPLVQEKPFKQILQMYTASRQMIIEPLPALPVTLLPESKTDRLDLLKAKEIKIHWQKKPAIPMLSRKERRQIARMKERALQRRIQNEFLKGRVPYVVPLNTNNF